MGVVSDLIDGVVEVSTGSAELVASKWAALVGGAVTIVVLLLLVVLLLAAPTVGIALAVILIAGLWVLSQGDNDVI